MRGSSVNSRLERAWEMPTFSREFDLTSSTQDCWTRKFRSLSQVSGNSEVNFYAETKQ